jgi:hypothetical protein
METKQGSKKSWQFLSIGAIGALALAVCLSVLSLPALAQQYPQNPPAATAPQYPNTADQGVPATLVLPPGTFISIRNTQWLSSDRNQPGDGFDGVLEQPLIVDGWVVARRGQTVFGQVVLAQRAGRVSGVSQLGVRLTELTLVDGQQVPLQTQLLRSEAGTSHGRDAAAIGTTTAVGAGIGGIAGGGKGAGIGAAVGAAAGIIGVLSTRGRPTQIPPETLLTFRLEDPVAFSTERGQIAFLPVSPEDYPSAAARYRPAPRYAVMPVYPPPPPPAYYYDYPPYPHRAYYYAPYGYGWGYYPAPAYFRFNFGYHSRPAFRSFHERGHRGFRR